MIMDGVATGDGGVFAGPPEYANCERIDRRGGVSGGEGDGFERFAGLVLDDDRGVEVLPLKSFRLPDDDDFGAVVGVVTVFFGVENLNADQSNVLFSLQE
jgi:hypothetical protein